MIALSHSTNSNSRSGALQLTRTSDREVTVFWVTAAVKAHAACSKASAGVLPHPRMPISASCAKCSHLAIRAACTELMIQAHKRAPSSPELLLKISTFSNPAVDANQHLTICGRKADSRCGGCL